ncbi:MAG: hypothetical protein AAF799_47265 [Myxococcota bacterium]
MSSRYGMLIGIVALSLPGLGCNGDDAAGASDDPTAPTGSTDTSEPPPTGQVGEIVRSIVEIPFGLQSTCEHDGAMRVISQRNSSIVPERMYSAGCVDPDGIRHLFVSVPVDSGHVRTHPVDALNGDSQVIFETTMDPATGSFSLTGNEVHNTDCLDAHGIVVSSDCSTVATLCRRPHFTSETEPFTKDLVVGFSGADDIDQPGPIGGEPSEAHVDYNDEMWLYEWTDNLPLSEPPDKYVVHKGIGPLTRARGLGNYYLVNGENDDSYGYGVRSSTGGGSRHVADAFLVIDRSSEYEIAEGRGYTWACGRGHTDFNRPTYNPATQQYAIWCNTDYNAAQEPGYRGLWFRTESMGDSDDNQFHVAAGGERRNGAVQVLRPLPNGDFLGVLIGSPELSEDWEFNDPTRVGLAHFDGTIGRLADPIDWIVSSDERYLGHAQLSILDEDRYLLGYADLYELGSADEPFRGAPEFMIPSEYHVVEIDGEGHPLTETMSLGTAGWGDQDTWTSLGSGEIAWAYVPYATLGEDGGQPGCSGTTLELSVYLPHQE